MVKQIVLRGNLIHHPREADGVRQDFCEADLAHDLSLHRHEVDGGVSPATVACAKFVVRPDRPGTHKESGDFFMPPL